MAYYNYKRVRDLIPEDFRTKFESSWKEETGEEYDETCDYDGTLWILAAHYIEYLQDRLKKSDKLVDLYCRLTGLRKKQFYERLT